MSDISESSGIKNESKGLSYIRRIGFEQRHFLIGV